MNAQYAQDGRLAVVTGASSGIGAALALRLAERGYDLLLVARNEDRLALLARKCIHTFGAQAEVIACDLADLSARNELMASLASRSIDVFCCNAGFGSFGFSAELDPAEETMQVELNVTAVHALTTLIVSNMVRRGRGQVLITGSTAGHQPMPLSATYSATKAFANTFAESLHAELKGSGVQCTLLAPGPVRTGFAETAGIGGMEGAGGSFVWRTPQEVAEKGVRALERGKRVAVPGAFAWLETLAGRYTPRFLLLPVLKHVLRRVSGDEYAVR